MSDPHQVLIEFDERNAFLWFVLGLHALAGAVSEGLAPAVEEAGGRASKGTRKGSSSRLLR